jgi:hypothetical protein
MKKIIIAAAALVLSLGKLHAFCGFYVAKADAKLFNKNSQVIIARDGSHTVITMSNDFQGDVKDFAIVVPVPVVLQSGDIRVVQQIIFDKIDAYTAPRLVEYYDENPCRVYDRLMYAPTSVKSSRADTERMVMEDEAKANGVTIEATYTVGEYDIMILSAKESDGLKIWLTQNGYKLPEDAEEVLDPYIHDGTKFFVAKVNLEQYKANGYSNLRPLQIQFDSPKFMLPIRLGMANANGTQDLTIYGFTRRGRMEVSNYRTTKLPTDREIPEFVQHQGLFGSFYTSLFDKAWRSEGRNSVMLEYAWDISGSQPVKCDPCPAPLVSFRELREAGVWWIEGNSWGDGYTGELFVTRLHARYSRDKFPQDLQFIATPNRQQFQGRYVVRHPASGPFDCEEGRQYQADLKRRKRLEVEELVALTGWDGSKFGWYFGGGEGKSGGVGFVEPLVSPDSAQSMLAMTQSSDSGLPNDDSVGKVSGTLGTGSDAFIARAQKSSTKSLGARMVIFISALGLLLAGLLVRKRIPQIRAGGPAVRP